MNVQRFTKQAVKTELTNIADWWLKNAIDETSGGFVGEIGFDNKPVVNANKGIVLNSRILWFFSELALTDPQERYRKAANRAYDYLLTYFDDRTHGGAFWEVSANGQVVNSKKQTYAQNFCIYAFCAYYKLTNNILALEKALSYFDFIEKYALDHKHGGYLEAFTRDWQPIDDFRLSDKDLNCPKSMNTHLHILEAYNALYSAAPSRKSKKALIDVIKIFETHVIDSDCNHLRLFFDNEWKDLSSSYSFGHDIEATWLVWEAAENSKHPALMKRLKPLVIAMADTCLEEAIGVKGNVCDEFDFAIKTRHEESFWWIQAEALVGFMHAFEWTGREEFKQVCDSIWCHIQHYHLDHQQGEWHWLSSADKSDQTAFYKAGFWKSPYHNGRAMMELSKSFDRLGLD